MRYRPLMELGRGGMARVYLAESLASGLLHKLVVLKVLNQELAADPEMRSGFTREAEISARLNHPNIVNVYEVFEQGNTPVMVMQYVDGMALSEIVSRLSGKVPLKLHLHILCQVLDALHYVHQLKTASGDSLECVHRDVTPHNVMVLHEGGIKVVDFGVAKVRAHAENHTRTGVIKGKVSYMAPEQLLACANVDGRADIYSVGVMLWEAVAGHRMWRGLDPSARMRAIVMGAVPDIREAAPTVSDALARIIERALAHTPDGRYATAQEMQIELEQVAHTEGGYSLPRELAEFMRLHFGEDRREKQRAIEEAVGDPEFSVADASWSVSRPPAVSSGRPAVQAANTDPRAVYAPHKRWRKAIAFAVVAAASCIGAMMLLDEPAAEQAATAPVAPVTLRVQSEPAGAEVYLDGIKLGVTPLLQTRGASAQPSTIEVRAPGRVTRTKVIKLEDDVAMDVALVHEAREPAHSADVGVARGAGEPDADDAPDANEQDRAQPFARQRRPVQRASGATRARPQSEAEQEPEVSAPAAPPEKAQAVTDNCDPPYRLDPGGVKVFKPQCF
jgi:serine/threonine protein kinase